MRLILTKPIVGIRDRGKPTESRLTYADVGDRVKVLFNNTTEYDNGFISGHYICELGDQHFVVFPSQYDRAIIERGADNNIITTKDDLLYSEPTDEVEDTILE